MEHSSVVKFLAAFVAGIVVALGSALIYVKVSDVPSHVFQVPPAKEHTVSPPEPVSTQPEKPDEPVVGQSAAVKAPKEPEKPEKAPSPAVIAKRAPVHRKHVSHPVNTSVVEVAQNTPPSPPPADPPPPAQPAVNENSAPASPLPDAQTQNNPPVVSQPNPVQEAPPPPQPHVVTLQPGTNLVVRLGETLSTDHNYTGDTFRGTLDAPIIMDGFIIADKGSKVLGRIVTADRAGRLQGAAALQLTLTEINTTDGQRVHVETGIFDKKGPSNANQDAAKIAGGAALGAVIGAIGGGGKGAAIGAGVGGAAGTGAVLLSHGKPAVLPAETRLTFQLAQPTTITEKLN